MAVGGDRLDGIISRFWWDQDEAPGTSSLEARPGNTGAPLTSECYLPAFCLLDLTQF